MADMLKAPPLGSVRGGHQSGNVLIYADMNSYGDTDHQPHLRPCPLDPKTIKKWVGAALEARCGSQEPDHLLPNDIFLCINGGKDRRAAWCRQLMAVKVGGKDPNRSFQRHIMLHMTEQARRGRRKRV